MLGKGPAGENTFANYNILAMKIDINDHRKLFAIQEEFGTLFPNLRLEFYARPANSGAAHPKKPMSSYAHTLGECRNVHNKGTITISPNMTVADLKSNFSDVYGVEVDVLKKKGDTWLETTSQNTLSLTEQNH